MAKPRGMRKAAKRAPAVRKPGRTPRSARKALGTRRRANAASQEGNAGAA